MITLLVIALLVIPVSLAFGSNGSSNAVKPSVVLVHGAWADSSSWGAVIARLQDQGYTVYSFPNPLRGPASDSAYLASFLATITGPIILVGHSYGGAVITMAATGNSNVKALVYVDAFATDQGETGVSLLSMPPPLGQAASCVSGDPNTVFNLVPLPNHDVDLYVKQSLFPSCFANDLPQSKAAVLASAQRPLTFSSLTEQAGAPAWKTIPSWYLVGTLDHVIPPYLQLFMANRINAHITEVKGSHLVMISHPEAVVDLIQQASQSISGSDNNGSRPTLAPVSL